MKKIIKKKRDSEKARAANTRNNNGLFPPEMKIVFFFTFSDLL
nr:hypothetical protein [uncultured Allomuricauda sp.]